MKNNSLEEIRSVLDKYNDVILCGHTNPDGDAIGANLALATSLSLKGKNVRVLLEDYNGKYDAIPNKHFVVNKDDIDLENVKLFVTLDCGDIERIEGFEHIFEKAETTINIDHHKSNPYFGQYNYVFDEASSTSELIYDIIEDYYPMNKEVATALYAGLIFDTGGFRHTSTSPSTMRIAGELMKQDIPFNEIYIKFFDSKKISEVRIMGKGIDNTKLVHNEQVAYTTLTNQEIAECGGTHEELDGIINYIKGIDTVKVACFFYEKPKKGVVKVSFRSDDGYDVSEFAQKFGGGGHVKAAGCSLNMDIKEAVEYILEEIKVML